jgi:hypothetical protein
MNFQLVIARYNENIDYLMNLKDVAIVYNKGNDDSPFCFETIKLPNVGRESHTYLYHIINNYNNLANTTMFIQGNINDHKLLNFVEYLKNIDLFTGRKTFHNIDILKGPIKYNGKFLQFINSGNLKRSKYIPFDWINKIGIDIKELTTFEMIYGANFSVSKELILKKPIEFYKDIIKYVSYDNNPEEGHFFERTWYMMFIHGKFIKKNIIYYHYSETITLNLLNKFKQILEEKNEVSEIHIWTSDNLKSLNQNELKVNYKYLNKNEYITIFPKIDNNSFFFKINENGYLLLEFFNYTYEILFENNNIQIYDCNNNEMIISKYLNESIRHYNLKISWTNYSLLINDFCSINLFLLNTDIVSIKVKSVDSFIEYENEVDLYNNIFLFYTIKNNMDLSVFYKDNYEDFYTIEY